MNRDELNQLVISTIDEIQNLMFRKGAEYANNDQVFHNFIQAEGLSFHECKEAVLWEYMTKHLQSIKDIIKHIETGGYNGYPTAPLIKEKINDVIVYMLLLKAMLMEGVQSYDDNIKPIEK